MSQTNTKENTDVSDMELLFILFLDGFPLNNMLVHNIKNNDRDTYDFFCFLYYNKKAYAKALPWLRRAAAHNNSKAQFGIACMYYHGQCLPQDYKQAMSWYLKAANNDGDRDAQSNIGMMYLEGLGVSKNIDTAIHWLTKAANQRCGAAYHNLGHIYEYEFEEYQIAVNCYKKSLDNGNERSKANLKELCKKGFYPKQDNKDKEMQLNDIGSSSQPKKELKDQDQQSVKYENGNHVKEYTEEKIKNVEESFQLKLDQLQKEVGELKLSQKNKDKEIQKLKQTIIQCKTALSDNLETDISDS